MRAVGCTTQVSNSRGGRLPAQVSKICSASAPAARLHRQVVDRRHRSADRSAGEALRVAIGPQPRIGLIRRTATGHHVGRDRPGRAAEADECRFIGKILPKPRHRLAHDAEPGPSRSLVQARKIASLCEPARAAALRLPRTRPSGPAHAAPPGCRRTGWPHRSRSAGSAATSPRPPGPACSTGSRKPPALRTHRAVLRQVAPRLPHQPDRRRRQMLRPAKGARNRRFVALSTTLMANHSIIRILDSESCCFDSWGVDCGELALAPSCPQVARHPA